MVYISVDYLCPHVRAAPVRQQVMESGIPMLAIIASPRGRRGHIHSVRNAGEIAVEAPHTGPQDCFEPTAIIGMSPFFC